MVKTMKTRQQKASKVERKEIKQYKSELEKTEVISKITQHQSCFGEGQYDSNLYRREA